MSSGTVVMMVGQHGGFDPDTMALMMSLAAAGVLGQALRLLHQGKHSAVRKLVGAVKGEKGGRCGTKRKYDWEIEVLGKPCATCYDAQVKREFKEDGY